MSAGDLLWVRLGGGAALAAGLLVLLRPPENGLPEAPLLGAAIGLALFACVERTWPPVRRPAALDLRVWIGKHLVLVGWAGVEEVVWRALVFGQLARLAGAVVALAASSVAFGLWHRSARLLHVLTGACFGSVFLCTGSLAAAWAAHAAYNAAVAATADSRRPRPGAPP